MPNALFTVANNCICDVVVELSPEGAHHNHRRSRVWRYPWLRAMRSIPFFQPSKLETHSHPRTAPPGSAGECAWCGYMRLRHDRQMDGVHRPW